jgi:hypothetical protein
VHTNAVGLFSNVSTVKGATAPDNIAFVGISQFDKCTLTTLIDGFGQTAKFDQVVKNNLSNGTMKISLDFSDFSNARVVPVTVDVSFKATAKATRTKLRDEFESEGVLFKSSIRAESRAAVATGTITFGTETLIAPGVSSVLASIDGAITKEKTQARPEK